MDERKAERAGVDEGKAERASPLEERRKKERRLIVLVSVCTCQQ